MTSKSVVSRVVKRYNQDNSLPEMKKCGRPSKTEQREDRAFVRMARLDRFKLSRKLKIEFNVASGKTISHTTVIRLLDAAGYKSNIAAHKPLLSKKEREKSINRICQRREHQTWTQAQWNRVHFSDESKFNDFSNDGQRFVWRKPGERLPPQCMKTTVKSGGGSVMRWGMMSAAGVRLIVRVQETLNADFHKILLIQNAVPNLQSTTGQSAIFM